MTENAIYYVLRFLILLWLRMGPVNFTTQIPYYGLSYFLVLIEQESVPFLDILVSRLNRVPLFGSLIYGFFLRRLAGGGILQTRLKVLPLVFRVN